MDDGKPLMDRGAERGPGAEEEQQGQYHEQRESVGKPDAAPLPLLKPADLHLPPITPTKYAIPQKCAPLLLRNRSARRRRLRGLKLSPWLHIMGKSTQLQYIHDSICTLSPGCQASFTSHYYSS